MLLIAGSCIGAGMLALPILTGMAGFFPSFVMFFIAWIFMTTTGLLLVEVNGWFEHPVNFISMVGHTLGMVGRVLCWLLYLFLFYALLVAYMVGSGNHVSNLLMHLIQWNIPDWIGTIFFVILFGWVVYLGTYPVDLLNRGLMIGKILAYLLLIILGLKYITPKLLLYTDIKYSLFALPILLISFGFQNMIPSLSVYLGGDTRRIRMAIIGGSLFTFCIYLFWQLIALGILPVSGKEGIISSFHNDIDAAQSIRNYLKAGWVGSSAQILAFFAILTSFLAQSLALVHFLRDGLKINRKKREHVSLCALALLPPLVFSILFPQIFFQALNFAGGICAVILFGVFPAMMVWIGRYRKNIRSENPVRGGKPLLICIFVFGCFIFFYQLTNMLGLTLFPHP